MNSVEMGVIWSIWLENVDDRAAPANDADEYVNMESFLASDCQIQPTLA